MAKNKYSNIYQFKISLKGISPPIWRRIQVPENYTFWNLHVAIQDSMGWWDSHLHSFGVKNPVSGEKEEIGIPSDDFFNEIPMLPGCEEKISERFTEENTKVEYIYDFGDSWHHEVKLEKILQREENVKYPRCIAGKRACPPEDCGGIWGYHNLLEITSNPSHEEYEEMMEWLGEYNPEAFDPRKVKFDNPEKRLKNIL